MTTKRTNTPQNQARLTDALNIIHKRKDHLAMKRQHIIHHKDPLQAIFEALLCSWRFLQ